MPGCEGRLTVEMGTREKLSIGNLEMTPEGYNKSWLLVEHERSFEVQAILSKHNLMRLSRIEAFSSFLEAVLSELKKREESLSSLSTEKLLALGLSLEGRLSVETGIEILSSIESTFERERTQRISVD